MEIANVKINEIVKVWPLVSSFVSVPHTEEQYENAVRILDELIDRIGEDENHPLASLMETLGTLIETYENQHLPETASDPVGVLKFWDYSKYSSFMSEKENPNSILKKTTDGQRKGLQLFREMMTDFQIASDLETRQKKVSSFPWNIVVQGGDDNDNQQANLLEQQIKPIYGELLGEIQDALPLGFSVTELMWEVLDGRLELPAVLGHDQENFLFTGEWELMMKSEGGGEDSKVPSARVVLATFNKRKGNLYGNSLLTPCFWPWYFKKHGWFFWSTYIEKFGMPTVVGKFPQGTPKEEQDTLLECCQAIQSDMAVTVPEKWVLELLEAVRGGTADTYEKFLKYCDMAISKVILLSVLTSNESQFGTKAQAVVHMDLTDQVIQSDARWVARILTNQVIKHLAQWNYNFSTPPELVIQYPGKNTNKDMAQRDKILSDTVPVAIHNIHQKFHLTTPDHDTIVTYRGYIGSYGKLLQKMQTQPLPRAGNHDALINDLEKNLNTNSLNLNSKKKEKSQK